MCAALLDRHCWSIAKSKISATRAASLSSHGASGLRLAGLLVERGRQSTQVTISSASEYYFQVLFSRCYLFDEDVCPVL